MEYFIGCIRVRFFKEGRPQGGTKDILYKTEHLDDLIGMIASMKNMSDGFSARTVEIEGYLIDRLTMDVGGATVNWGNKKISVDLRAVVKKDFFKWAEEKGMLIKKPGKKFPGAKGPHWMHDELLF